MTSTRPPTIEIIDGPEYARDDEGWEHYAFTLRVRFGRRRMTTPWKQGLGVMDDPDLGSVMSSLISDAQGLYAGQDFEDWCSDYGYDTDSRKAEALYGAVKRQSAKVRRLLGDEIVNALNEDDDATYGSTKRFLAAWERATR